jgi:uncharacterized protein YidB (DUF937 family)
MDVYNYVLNNFPQRNEEEKVGVATAIAVLFGHPHPRDPSARPGDDTLGGVLDRFRSAGLGHIAASWIGPGHNDPISPHDLGRVIGDELLGQMVRHSGMRSRDQLLPLLARVLPMMVDKMTPNGRVPQRGGILGALTGIFGR